MALRFTYLAIWLSLGSLSLVSAQDDQNPTTRPLKPPLVAPGLPTTPPVLKPQAIDETRVRAPKEDSKARALFMQAAKTQFPDGIAPVIKTFQAEYPVELFEDMEGKSHTKKTGTISQHWKLKKKQRGTQVYYHRSLHTDVGNVAPVHYHVKGKTCYSQIEGKQARDLQSEESFQAEYKNIRGEAERTTELLKFFFLQHLLSDDCIISMGRQGLTHEDPRSGNALPLNEVILYRPKERLVTLRFGQEDHRVYAADLAPKSGADHRLTFRFDYHQLIPFEEKPKKRNLLLPMRVEILRNGKLVARVNTKNPRLIQFNRRITDRVFDIK